MLAAAFLPVILFASRPVRLLFEALLVRARAGDAEAIGQLLQHYRDYLHLIAQRRLVGRLRARVDASDIVQQTLLEAQQDLPAFRGESEDELVAWLAKILHNNVYQTIQRHLLAQKRSAKKERSLDEPLAEGRTLGNYLAADWSSPSQRAMRGEAAVRLARAIRQLASDQQEAVRLRHLEGMSLKQIAQEMDRSEVAVAGLIKRGLQRLREILAESSEQSGGL